MKIEPGAFNQIDTARRIGVSLGTLRRWTVAGIIPYSRVGRTIRYPRAWVESFARGEVRIDLPKGVDE